VYELPDYINKGFEAVIITIHTNYYTIHTVGHVCMNNNNYL